MIDEAIDEPADRGRRRPDKLGEFAGVQALRCRDRMQHFHLRHRDSDLEDRGHALTLNAVHEGLERVDGGPPGISRGFRRSLLW